MPLGTIAQFLTDNYGNGITPWYPQILELQQSGEFLVLRTSLGSADGLTASRMCVAASAALLHVGFDPVVSVRDAGDSTVVRRTGMAVSCDLV